MVVPTVVKTTAIGPTSDSKFGITTTLGFQWCFCGMLLTANVVISEPDVEHVESGLMGTNAEAIDIVLKGRLLDLSTMRTLQRQGQRTVA